MLENTVLGRLRNSIKTTVKASARNNVNLVEPTVAMIGAISKFAERKIRQKLSLPPRFVEFNRSPAGPSLPSPIRMSTCEGRDQISRLIYYKGWAAFEHPFPSLLETVLAFTQEGLFFDVGANTGLYSLLSKAICPKRDVHAFEPFYPVLDILKANIALNRFAADIVVVDAAASDESGVAEMFIPTQEHGLVENSASLSSTFKSRHSGIVAVKTVRLDDYCGQAGLGPVSVMKIDVEGAEDRVLSGAAKLMVRDKPIIFCEIMPNADTWSVITSILAKAGYLRAAIHRKALVVQEDAIPDPNVNNHVLFPRSLEPMIVEVARTVNLRYRA